jgi:hypothetical protein
MKRNKLSHTSVSLYNECGRKYKLHYIDKIRSKDEKSALYFGKCLDNALNILLLNKDLNEALKLFEIDWKNAPTNLKYSKSDYDQELIDWEDKVEGSPWDSLRIKGELLIMAYHTAVLPKIKNVVIIQKPVSIKNNEGDEVAGFLDLIVEWEDGKTYLMDNKSSSIPYSLTSAKESQQLVLYYYLEKDNYKLDGVGFIVLSKKINKNKVKTCKVCGTTSTGREKTCAKMVLKPGRFTKEERCNNEFSISYNPTVDVQFIINQVDEKDEDKCVDTFDLANNGILNQNFEPNFRACVGKYGKCVYFDYCKRDSMEGLIKKEQK